MQIRAVDSPTASPGWPTPFPRSAPFDLEVVFGEVPRVLPDAIDVRRWIHVAEQKVLVRFPHRRRVLIEDGQRVTIHWPTEPDDAGHDHTWVISSWGVPVAMLQRGLLPLHASTVRVGDAVVAVAGRSGSGKSTTSIGLRSRGHDLIVDESTLLETTEHGVLVHPFERRIHLTAAAANRFGFAAADMRPVALSPGKVALAHTPRSMEPLPLTHVVALQTSDVPDVGVEVLTGPLSMATLSVHAQRMGLAPLVLGRERYLGMLRAVADQTSVVALHRPSDDWSLEVVLDAVEELAGAGAVASPPGDAPPKS